MDAQNRSEQAMRESEERLRQFAEHSTNVLHVWKSPTANERRNAITLDRQFLSAPIG
jgi:hypothetical protein